jgi:hypothetical protein
MTVPGVGAVVALTIRALAMFGPARQRGRTSAISRNGALGNVSRV